MISFNLLSDPWIPIGHTTVSIRDALVGAHELPGWPGGDHGLAETVIRLLVPMVYRVAGLDDETTGNTNRVFAKKQAALFTQGQLVESVIDDYVGQQVDRFWLIGGPEHAQPFAQDPALDQVDPHEAAKAVAEWASGNNPVLGPHTDIEVLSPDFAAQRLLVLRAYAWGGLHTKHPDHPGRGKFVGAPLRGTMSVHPVGATLFETLVGHLVPLPGGATEFGVPFWEQPEPTNPVAAHRGRAGLLEQITGRHDKTMLLRTDDAGRITGFTLAEGPGVDRALFCDDPYLLLNPDREPVKPKTQKAFWRESEALLTETTKSPGCREAQARILDWASGENSDLYIKEQFSWVVVSHLGDKSKNLEWDRSVAPDLLSLKNPGSARDVLAFMSLANDAESLMAKQLAKVWHATDQMPSKPGDKAAVYRPARAEFWKRCEHDFWDVVNNGLDQRQVKDQVRSHAVAGFKLATDRAVRNHRALPAIVESLKWIEMWERPKAPSQPGPSDEQEMNP